MAHIGGRILYVLVLRPKARRIAETVLRRIFMFMCAWGPVLKPVWLNSYTKPCLFRHLLKGNRHTAIARRKPT